MECKELDEECEVIEEPREVREQHGMTLLMTIVSYMISSSCKVLASFLDWIYIEYKFL